MEGENKTPNSLPELGQKKQYFMHAMQKLAVDVTFTQMRSKKCIKKHEKRAVALMYKDYTQPEYMMVMGVLDPNSLTRSQKKVSLWAIYIKKKNGVGN